MHKLCLVLKRRLFVARIKLTALPPIRYNKYMTLGTLLRLHKCISSAARGALLAER
jgi:hypothetical protein